MQTTRSRWISTLAAVTMLILAGNAWGFSMNTDSGNWRRFSSWSIDRHELSNEGLTGRFSDRWSERYGDGMMDDDSDAAGDSRYDFGRELGFPSGSEGAGASHKVWREILLQKMFSGSGLAEWVRLKKEIWSLKKEIWTELGDQYRQHNETTAVPVPAALLFFGSGLVGLAGFVRRSRRSRSMTKS